jgi:hypothetical protein
VKRKALALTLIIVISFSTVVGMQFTKLTTKANPDGFTEYVIVVSIESPLNKTYGTNKIALNITALLKFGPTLAPLTAVRYSVDGGSFIYFADPPEGNSVANESTLLDLPEGTHIIVAKARTFNAEIPLDMEACANVTFTIDTAPPRISVLTVENKTYDTSDVPLSFAVNEPDSQISYSLDGRHNVTFLGNTTLAGLPNGEHSIVVFATDEAGNVGASKTVYFSVEAPEPEPKPEPQPEPFPTIAVIASVIAVCVAGIALSVYFKKRKR